MRSLRGGQWTRVRGKLPHTFIEIKVRIQIKLTSYSHTRRMTHAAVPQQTAAGRRTNPIHSDPGNIVNRFNCMRLVYNAMRKRPVLCFKPRQSCAPRYLPVNIVTFAHFSTCRPRGGFSFRDRSQPCAKKIYE